jgi:hypothetical protein
MLSRPDASCTRKLLRMRAEYGIHCNACLHRIYKQLSPGREAESLASNMAAEMGVLLEWSRLLASPDVGMHRLPEQLFSARTRLQLCELTLILRGREKRGRPMPR